MNSILIADDHDLFREGLRTIINHWQDFKVVGEASNGEDTIKLAREMLPDIILMDISMPVLDGLKTTKIISRELPFIKIIILTASEENSDLFNAINYGACGYILKNVQASKLHSYLTDASRGEVAFSNHMASKIIRDYKSARDFYGFLNGTTPLSEREIQILELIVEGMTNSEIGKRIFLSEHSVKKYLCNILQKLHLNNRVEAAVYAVREGIVPGSKGNTSIS